MKHTFKSPFVSLHLLIVALRLKIWSLVTESPRLYNKKQKQRNAAKKILSKKFPKLSYWYSLFTPTNRETRERVLQVAQKSSPQLNSLKMKFNGTASLLNKLHWLPVKFMIRFEVARFGFTCFQKLQK